MRPRCPHVAKPVLQQQRCFSVKSDSGGNSPSLESDWPTPPGPGTQALGCSPGLACVFAGLWRRLFLLQTQHSVSYPPGRTHLHICCLSLPHQVQHSRSTGALGDVPVLQGWLQISANGLCGRERGRSVSAANKQDTSFALLQALKQNKLLLFFMCFIIFLVCVRVCVFGGGGVILLSAFFLSQQLKRLRVWMLFTLPLYLQRRHEQVYPLTPLKPRENARHKETINELERRRTRRRGTHCSWLLMLNLTSSAACRIFSRHTMS